MPMYEYTDEERAQMAAPRPGDIVSPVNGAPLPMGYRFTPGERQREISSKAGKAAHEKAAKKRALREELIDLLTADITDKDGNQVNTQTAVSLSLIRAALEGNVKAFETIRDTIGEKPVQEIRVDNHLIPEMSAEEIAAEWGEMPGE